MNRLQELLKQNHLMRPLVMGILNVTPDSFSDGGRFNALDQSKSQIERMLKQRVDIVDIGGESTRPGADFVSEQQELDRVMPVLEWLGSHSDILVSVDTYKPAVMQAAVEQGVELINDVNAMQSVGALEAVAGSNAMVCLMHKQGRPKTMQDAPYYEDVVSEVVSFLQARSEVCQAAGIDKNKIIVDPGFGFGKTLDHNLRLFEELDRLVALDYPVLVGVSRKKMLGQLLSEDGVEMPVDSRGNASVVSATLAAMKGVNILRVHDYVETVQAVKLLQALV